jgi:hypothetical protein
VVYANEPFAGPRQVLRYLSHYTHRIAISNRRLLSADQNGITFNCKDYRIEGPARYKMMTLATDEFIRRFLIHVLPKGFHRIMGCSPTAIDPETLRTRASCSPCRRAAQNNPRRPKLRSNNPALPRPFPYCGSRMIIIETFACGCEPKYRPTPPAAIRIDTS